MALSASEVSESIERQKYSTEYVTQRQLPGQCHDGELLWTYEVRVAIFAEVGQRRAVREGTGQVHTLLQ